jgi:hypothetical protein
MRWQWLACVCAHSDENVSSRPSYALQVAGHDETKLILLKNRHERLLNPVSVIFDVDCQVRSHVFFVIVSSSVMVASTCMNSAVRESKILPVLPMNTYGGVMV